MKRNLYWFLAALLIPCLAQAQPSAPARPSLAFKPGVSNSFTFDTGVLRGVLREGGQSKGLSSVIHIPTGTRVDGAYGLAGHYRVFSANHRYGVAAWDWPSTARLLPNGTVEVRWPAAPDRPLELGAVYRWATPNTLEVETSVRAQTNLVKFESFFASYFAQSFTNSVVHAREAATGATAEPFMHADPSRGVWLAFPRDDAAWQWMTDGRWKLPPNPVDWVRMPPLSSALAVRRSPSTGVSVAFSSSLSDCFAILTPQELEPHYSMYLSLFGRDLRPGEEARAKVKLIFLDTLSDSAILRAAGRLGRQAR